MNSLEIWENSLANRSVGTRRNYRFFFRWFSKFTGLSPDELRQIKYKENQEAKPWERNKVENIVRSFIRSLEEKGKTCNTQKLAIASIRSFFSAQGMPLNLNKTDNPAGCAFGSKALTKDEIYKLKNASESLREKALVMFLKDSGLRESDASKLRWKDFKNYGDGFWGFQIQTKKKGIKARGFAGSESTELLTLYKNKRLEGTKKLPPEENIEEHPVFALLAEPTKAVSPTRMSGNLGNLIKLAKVDNATGHGLRKFWEQNVHVEHEAYQKQMNGRALDAVERSYYWLEIEQLFELYRKNYSNLRIEKNDFKEAEERIRRDYEREIRNLKQQLEERDQRFRERDIAIENMSKRLEQMEQKIESYNSYKGVFNNDTEMELFAKSLLFTDEYNKRISKGMTHEEAWKDLRKAGIITDEKLGIEKGQELSDHINSIIGRMLLFDLAHKRKNANKKEDETDVC